jgi:hypothetical protein
MDTNPTKQRQQFYRDRLVFACSPAGLPMEPGVKPTTGNLQDLAHLPNAEGLPVLLYEPKLHF